MNSLLVFAFIVVSAATASVVSPLPERVCLGEGEEYRECGTACPLTCTRPETQPCTLQCVPGCFCRRGLYRDTESGRCLSWDECQNVISGQYN